ncbi:MAG: monovalent cation/H+ antiporter complex subunit F [Gammaproteobacteria bacterium]|nr:monovalent cation/H+ antiporter complex subunit F [Gammaproteobacteria bacterium]
MSQSILSASSMTILLLLALIVLLITLMIGLRRAWLGPTIQDRFSALLLLGTGGVAVLMLLGVLMALPALYDVALVLALLAVVITVALTRTEVPND